MKQGKRTVFYTKAQKVSIIQEYVDGDYKLAEIAQKYKLSNGSVISNWMRTLKIPGKSVLLQQKAKFPITMSNKNTSEDTEALKARIKDLEQQLNWAKLQALALNELIEVAESQGMPVRKKAGAKR